MSRLTTIIASTAFAVFLLMAPQGNAHAQTQFELGPAVGYELNSFDALVAGADGRIQMEQLPVIINPAFEYYFIGDQGFGDTSVTAFKVSANALYEFEIEGDITPYAGAGLGYTRMSVSADGDFGGAFSVSGSDVGLNLIGGAIFDMGSIRPFAEGGFTLTSGDMFTIGGGLLFEI